MKFKYIQIDSLPRLAWCARVCKGNDTVIVYHGSQVEQMPDFFIEGAWNGKFTSDGFATATILCGTGAMIDSGQLRFCSSTDKLSPIFSIRKPDTIHVSNSPLFLLSAAEEEPDPIYPFYGYDLIRIWRQGLHCPDGTFKTASKTPLHIHICTIMTVERDLSASFEPHPLDDCPKNYEQYKQLLTNGVKEVFRNSEDPQRQVSYSPLAMTSKGYDSGATSALAASAGCKEAITLIDSCCDDPTADSGADIARTMGMNCAEYDRWAYRNKKKPVDAEFALFTLSNNAPVAACEEILNRRILITGHFGVIWDKSKPKNFNSLCETGSKKVAGMGQLEFRLRVGFQTFTPPYIGARHNQAIHKITNSDQMKNWRIGGHYDRPIPRRIIEEAGVPRGEFAIKKKAGGHATYNRADHFSVRGLKDYKQFVKKSHASIPRSRYILWYLLAQGQHLLWRLLRTRRKQAVPTSKYQRRFPFLLNSSPLRIPWKHMFLFQWAFDSLRERYQLPDEFNVRPDGIGGSVSGSSAAQERTKSLGKSEVN